MSNVSDSSRVPATLVVTTVTILFPRQNPDGTWSLPGAEEIVQAVSKNAAASAAESLQGMGGDLLALVGYTGEGIKYVPPPPPVIPVGTWPIPSAVNQDLINAIGKAFGNFDIIPAAIFKEMTVDAKHRHALYRTLESARPLESWQLSSAVLERLKAALRTYKPKLLE